MEYQRWWIIVIPYLEFPLTSFNDKMFVDIPKAMGFAEVSLSRKTGKFNRFGYRTREVTELI